MEMISKETLQKYYTIDKMTMKEISDLTGLAVGTVYNYIKKYNIQSRPAMTELTKKKISKSLSGRTSPLKGTKCTEETKKKISEAHKGIFLKPSKYGGHRKKKKDGYIRVYNPMHPRATADGYVMEHILVMEEAIKRHLTEEEVVHHKNKIRDDNRLENLQLMTFREHAGFHMKERWQKRKEKQDGTQ